MGRLNLRRGQGAGLGEGLLDEAVLARAHRLARYVIRKRRYAQRRLDDAPIKRFIEQNYAFAIDPWDRGDV